MKRRVQRVFPLFFRRVCFGGFSAPGLALSDLFPPRSGSESRAAVWTSLQPQPLPGSGVVGVPRRAWGVAGTQLACGCLW